MCDPIGRLVDPRIVERPEPLIFGRLRALAVVEGRGSPAEDVGLPLSAAAVAAVPAFAVAADAVVGAGRTSGSSATSCCSVGSTTVLVTTASHKMAATSPMSRVIAQEVQTVPPDAVTRGSDGYIRVYYERLGLKFRSYDRWVVAGGLMPRTTGAPR